MPRYIRRASLLKALQASSSTVSRWEREGLFKAAYTANNESHYDLAQVNERLRLAAKAGCVKDEPPTFDDLKDGTFLVKTPAVAVELGYSVTYIDWLVHQGRLEALRLANEFLVFRSSVERYKSSVNSSVFLLRSDVGKVLGAGRGSIDSLVKAGKMVFVSGDRRRRIPRASLARYLRSPGVLPSWINPEFWIDFRLMSDLPLLSMQDAAPQVGGIDELRRLMEAHKVWHVSHPGGHKQLILHESLLHYVRQLPPVSLPVIARQFGTTPPVVDEWLRNRLLECPVHPHRDYLLAEPCVIALVGAHLSPGTSAHKWYRARKDGKTPLLTPAEAGRMLAQSPAEIIADAEAGRIHGLRNPDGLWLFSEAHIEHIRYERLTR